MDSERDRNDKNKKTAFPAESGASALRAALSDSIRFGEREGSGNRETKLIANSL